jgi:hypothetical protein
MEKRLSGKFDDSQLMNLYKMLMSPDKESRELARVILGNDDDVWSNVFDIHYDQIVVKDERGSS